VLQFVIDLLACFKFMQLNLVECQKMSKISENNMRHWQQCSFDTSPADDILKRSKLILRK
jgi:hypothetical protein